MESEVLALPGKELHKILQPPEPTNFTFSFISPFGLCLVALLEIQLPQNGSRKRSADGMVGDED